MQLQQVSRTLEMRELTRLAAEVLFPTPAAEEMKTVSFLASNKGGNWQLYSAELLSKTWQHRA